jgi:hypothetical protein
MSSIIFSLVAVSNPSAQAPPPGVPEPGLIIYGSVTNLNGNYGIISSPTLWNISGGGSSVTVTSTIVVVANSGQYFHVTRVPFESRTVSSQTFNATSNTLPLVNGVTYTRAAAVKGTNATIVSSSRNMLGTFTFSSADRGLIERVNLTVNLPGITFQDWLGRYPGLPVNQRGENDDPDGDGMTNFAEYRAGTDPTKRDSVFEFIDIKPNAAGGIEIRWSSASGKKYSVERAKDLGGTFQVLEFNVDGSKTEPFTAYQDTNATGVGPYFYRLTVQ